MSKLQYLLLVLNAIFRFSALNEILMLVLVIGAFHISIKVFKSAKNII